MPGRPPRRCLGCGRSTTQPRCPACDAAQHAARYGHAWAKHARQTILLYRARNGDICPGWRRDPHQINPEQWTLDHEVGPLCRACNSGKRDRT